MRQLILRIIGIVIVASLVACGTTGALKDVKGKYAKGNFDSIAKIEIKCKDSDAACNQLHLIKGDACYRLAKQGKDASVHFDCAINHLSKGIELTKDWKLGDLDLGRDQTYENLCESLRERQDMSRGKEAEQITRRLLETSGKFAQVSPGNLAAIYFVNSAKFTLLRGPILSSPEDPQVCAAVNEIVSNLKTVGQEAAASKYAENYSRLSSDVVGIKSALVNCP